MTEFSDKVIPSYPGVLTGIRTFEIMHGQIRSPQQSSYRWQEGINSAGCVYDDHSVYFYSSLTGSTLKRSRVDHKVASMECTCGLYGYFSARNAGHYLPAFNGLIGVVKVHGRVVVGQQGFRAEKAEIVALAPVRVEKSKGHPRIPPTPKKWPVWVMALFGVAMIMAIFLPSLELVEETTTYAAITMGLIAAFYAQWILEIRRRRRYSKKVIDYLSQVRDYKHNIALTILDSPVTDEALELVKHKYPTIEWYETVEDMLDVHQLSNPEGLTSKKKPD